MTIDIHARTPTTTTCERIEAILLANYLIQLSVILTFKLIPFPFLRSIARQRGISSSNARDANYITVYAQSFVSRELLWERCRRPYGNTRIVPCTSDARGRVTCGQVYNSIIYNNGTWNIKFQSHECLSRYITCVYYNIIHSVQN